MYPSKPVLKIAAINTGDTIKIASIAYIVEHMQTAGANVARNGWTHSVAVRKPNGKKYFTFYYDAVSGVCGTMVAA